MKGMIMAAQLLLSLSLLVTVHELGHFLAARVFKIKVEKFYLFFDFLFPMTNLLNFSLLKYKRGDTEYGVGWFPLGGYVKIAGMVDESGDDPSRTSDPQPWEFRAKPAWQRLIVMLGGIAANVALGVLIFVGVAYWTGDTYIPNSYINNHGGVQALELAKQIGLQTGDKILKVNGRPIVDFQDVLNPEYLLAEHPYYTVLRGDRQVDIAIPADFAERLASKNVAETFLTPRLSPIVGMVVKGAPAERAGLQTGDRFVELNGVPMAYHDEVQRALRSSTSDTVSFTVLRDGKSISLTANLEGDGVLGFYPQGIGRENLAHARYGFPQSVAVGAERAFGAVFLQVQVFKKIFLGEVSLSKSLSGPIGIARAFGSEWNWDRFWRMTGLLSMALAFMNLLPIPGLDGGHVVFLVYEMVVGKELPERVASTALKVGLLLFLALMMFVFYNDIMRLIVGS